jgi:hypothetical protein
MAPTRLQIILEKYKKKQTYQLRDNIQYEIPLGTSQKFDKSFFPKAISLWNSLSFETRNSDSLIILKSKLIPKPNPLLISYYYGKRWPNIHHARLRLGCSGLNGDLHYNLHARNSPVCACGWQNENAHHFLNFCKRYDLQRTKLIDELKTLKVGLTNKNIINTNQILFGDQTISLNILQKMYKSLHDFITESRRFN